MSVDTPSVFYYYKYSAYAYRNNYEEKSTNLLTLTLLQE